MAKHYADKSIKEYYREYDERIIYGFNGDVGNYKPPPVKYQWHQYFRIRLWFYALFFAVIFIFPSVKTTITEWMIIAVSFLLFLNLKQEINIMYTMTTSVRSYWQPLFLTFVLWLISFIMVALDVYNFFFVEQIIQKFISKILIR